EAIKVIEKKNIENDIVDETLEIDEIVNGNGYQLKNKIKPKRTKPSMGIERA
nr:hypothetical protein [Tanacetum cinerariifolium]